MKDETSHNAAFSTQHFFLCLYLRTGVCERFQKIDIAVKHNVKENQHLKEKYYWKPYLVPSQPQPELK